MDESRYLRKDESARTRFLLKFFIISFSSWVTTQIETLLVTADSGGLGK